MHVERKFTQAGRDVFSTVEWSQRSCRITNLDGSAVFEMDDAEVPASWSQLATDIMVSKYFRKAGVPQTGEDGKVVKDDNGQAVTGPEHSARQVIHRLAGCWRHWGQSHGYFDSDEDAQAFYDELCHMMLHQMAAPNSPQWFNTGLNWAYGISGPPQGHWVTDPQSGETKPAEDAYSHPQPHACFIQSIDDDLVNPGGIMDLWVREARLFKYGSGTGTNFSMLRGENEPLSGGGKSSGLMSWLKIGDRAAGAIKSGGTTRRAAKMVCLDLDHPDVEAFIEWKVREEIKVAAMVEGMKHLPGQLAQTAERVGLDLNYDFNGEAYLTISGQNSNNSVRIPNEFFKRLDADEDWDLTWRTDASVAKTVPARRLWEQLCYAAWRCADPGVQYDTTINQWHTCPEGGRINASNPCSEYMFLDNTACNLASLNLLKFYDRAERTFDTGAFEHAVNIWTIVLEISVLMAAFPSQRIARRSYEYRTLGLGHANVGAMLMQAGIPYDCDEARTICGAITAIMTGRSYATSAAVAASLGPFPGYFKNREHMLRVVRNHRRAAYGVPADSDAAQGHDLGDYECLEERPVSLRAAHPEDGGGRLKDGQDLLGRARAAWDDALKLGQQHGFRNAQATVIAPTGTIGLLMDCDTTGVEPDFALVKFKKLAGGGYFKIANQSLKPALEALGYEPQQVRDILTHVMGRLSLEVPLPPADDDAKPSAQMFAAFLKGKGLNDEDLAKITDTLPTVFELQYAFSPWTLGQGAMARLGLTQGAQAPNFNLLKALGLTAAQIAALNKAICGTQTVEGAPHLEEAHMPVFDCANPPPSSGGGPARCIATEGHIRMMAAAQPFISGAISKTINLPATASVEDIAAAYRLSWELGLKANALYRDGCKLSQVLSNRVETDDEIEDDEAIEAGKEEVASDVALVADRIALVATEGTLGGTSGATDEQAADKIEKVVERIVERPLRRRLPDTRTSVTHKFNVAGHEGYLTVGLYENDGPGELFITMAKEGSTIGGLMDSLGTAISIALQYGVPVEALVNKFTHQRFEPAGMTHNPDIPMAKSLVDYIFRWMGMQFVPGYRAANAPRRSSSKSGSAGAGASETPEPSADRAKSGAAKANGGETATRDNGANGRGNGHGGAKPHAEAEPGRAAAAAKETTSAPAEKAVGTMTAQMKEMQADAPACDVCGTITVRNGTCYKCLNCGNSMGCS